MKNCKNCKSNCNGASKEGYAPNCTYYVTEGKKLTNADTKDMTKVYLKHTSRDNALQRKEGGYDRKRVERALLHKD